MRTKMPPPFSATVTGPDGVYQLKFSPLDEWDGTIDVTIAGEAMSWHVFRSDHREDGRVTVSGMTVGADVIWQDQFWFELTVPPAPAEISYWGNEVLWRTDVAGET